MSHSRRIPAYVIHLKKRAERKIHILEQFSGRDEFDIHIVEAIENTVGAIGLWYSLQHIIRSLSTTQDEYILICEDDHQFTNHYSSHMLHSAIEQAREKNADLLTGGVSGFVNAVEVSDKLWWVEQFSGLQFTIIFRKFFNTILEAGFGDQDAADYKLSVCAQHKFLVYPFISIQRDFGYSDATFSHHRSRDVAAMFENSSRYMQTLKAVSDYYRKQYQDKDTAVNTADADQITIPTFVIRGPGNTYHIKQQFAGRKEFDLTIMDACTQQDDALSLWQTIREVVQMAIDKGDDIIIICRDHHVFTPYYSWEYLLKNILEAYNDHVCILLGGVGRFTHAIPVTRERTWINSFGACPFMVIFRQLFQSILDEPFDGLITPDVLLSEITSNKMVMHPFISIPQNVDDITFKDSHLTPLKFDGCSGQIAFIKKILHKYSCQLASGK